MPLWKGGWDTLTEVDYKNEGLAANKDKSVSKVIMAGSR